MTREYLSQNKASGISNGLFLIGLGILFFTNLWWPGILLVIWITLFTRQFLIGRMYDSIISSVVLLGLFFASLFNYDWSFLVPILFIVGGLIIIAREYYYDDKHK